MVLKGKSILKALGSFYFVLPQYVRFSFVIQTSTDESPCRLIQYMMLQNNTYEKLARANAAAINGLQPKITVWNTGADASTDSTAPIRNLLQSLPPLLSTINEQTGIAPPSWLANLGPAEQKQALSIMEGKGKGTANG